MNRLTQLFLRLVPFALFLAACTPSTTGRIEGKATCDDQRKPVSGVAVLLKDATLDAKDPKRIVSDTKTDAEGQYVFADVKPGKYSLSISWSTQSVLGEVHLFSGDWTGYVFAQPPGLLVLNTGEIEVAAGNVIRKSLDAGPYCPGGN